MNNLIRIVFISLVAMNTGVSYGLIEKINDTLVFDENKGYYCNNRIKISISNTWDYAFIGIYSTKLKSIFIGEGEVSSKDGIIEIKPSNNFCFSSSFISLSDLELKTVKLNNGIYDIQSLNDSMIYISGVLDFSNYTFGVENKDRLLNMLLNPIDYEIKEMGMFLESSGESFQFPVSGMLRSIETQNQFTVYEIHCIWFSVLIYSKSNQLLSIEESVILKNHEVELNQGDLVFILW
jgi:hypothetical protein